MLPLDQTPDWDPQRTAQAWSTLPFIPGLELSRQLYETGVQPLFEQHFAGLPHSAALIGYGSDVLGFDDARSRDHCWGPRLLLFLAEEGFQENAERIDTILRQQLPRSICGYPTHYSLPNLADKGTFSLSDEPPGAEVGHAIIITTIPKFIVGELGWHPAQPLGAAQWLSFPSQRLRSLTAGGVWHDELGLQALRAQLAWYPPDLWRYLLACQWQQIGQEEPFVGRTAEAGDELGSRLLAARLAGCLIQLAFLQARQYAPYSKWLGTAFMRLPGVAQLSAHLQDALDTAQYPERERSLVAAYRLSVQQLNSLHLIPPVPDEPKWFFSRPFQVIQAEAIARALQASIRDEALRHLPLIGSVNQFSHSTDLLSDPAVLARLTGLYP